MNTSITPEEIESYDEAQMQINGRTQSAFPAEDVSCAEKLGNKRARKMSKPNAVGRWKARREGEWTIFNITFAAGVGMTMWKGMFISVPKLIQFGWGEWEAEAAVSPNTEICDAREKGHETL